MSGKTETSVSSISSSNRGSGISVTGISMTGISSSVSSTSISSMSNRGSGISSMGNWSSSIGSNWNLSHSVDWGGNSLGNSLDGVGTGFVDNWLVDSLVGTDGSSDVLGSISRDSLEDGLGNVVGPDDRGWLVGGNWGGDVGVSGLSHGVGQGRNLGDDLSIGMSLSGGVGKVASQPVVLYGSRVMCWGTDKVGGSIANDNSVSTAVSNQGGEEQEGLKYETD